MNMRAAGCIGGRSLWAAAITAAVILLGAWLRLDGLDNRPVHFDESINARILAWRLDRQAYFFDPAHFHGPLLGVAATQVACWRGEDSWVSLTKNTLRMTVSGYGLAMLLAALCFRPLLRPGAGLAGAAFLATSPLLVYYSRMFIHETPFAFFGMVSLMALLAFLEKPGLLYAALFGAGAGLMASTRETVVISLFAWFVASLIWLKQTHPGESAGALARHVWRVKVPFLAFAATLGLVLVALHYSDFMRHPERATDFFKTFLVYTTEAGHEKPPGFYAEMLVWPKLRAGVWWTEGVLLLLALYGYVRYPPGTCRVACRFLVHGGLLHLAVYSLIAYKTPWLACLGWVHVCLAAGMGVVHLVSDARGRWRVPAIALVLTVVAWQAVQAHRASFRYASDARNPYAYVPTSPDVERMAAWLEKLADWHPELTAEPVTVVGSYYWPLPWYLRSFDQVGYWETMPPGAASRPLVLVVGDASALEPSHALFPRGLRHEVPVTVAIRRDIWEKEQSAPAP